MILFILQYSSNFTIYLSLVSEFEFSLLEDREGADRRVLGRRQLSLSLLVEIEIERKQREVICLSLDCLSSAFGLWHNKEYEVLLVK